MQTEQVQQLVSEIERKDFSTAAHTWRVVLYARAMAEALGLAQDRFEPLTQAAALHDIGKLDIPSRILQKPGRLTGEEFEIIKLHTVAGFARMVSMGVEEDLILDLIKHHHERWDGKGYPFGLVGEEIPLSARFFAVIDSFDAMTSIRPYRQEIGPEAAQAALRELVEGSGTRYWPEAVEAFTTLYSTGRLDWILEYYNDRKSVDLFCPLQVARVIQL